jgi:hypothetical protein
MENKIIYKAVLNGKSGGKAIPHSLRYSDDHSKFVAMGEKLIKRRSEWFQMVFPIVTPIKANQ